MRQRLTLTRILLILSIINFALAAPVAVLGRPEVRLHANVTRNATATSRERREPFNDANPNDAPPPSSLADLSTQEVHHDPPLTPDNLGSDHMPPSPLTNILSQTAYADSPPPTPDIPGSLTGSEYVLPSPGSMPLTGFHSPPPPSPHAGYPGPSAPLSDPLTDILSQDMYHDSPPSTPDSLGSLTGVDYMPPSPGLPVAGPTGSPSLPPPSPYHSQPGPSAPPPNPLQTYCRRKCAAQPPPLLHHGQLGPSPNVLQTYCRRKCTKQSTPDRESFTESDYVPPSPGLPVAGSSLPHSQLVPSSSPPSSLADMSSQVAPMDISPPTTDSLGSLTGVDYVPPSPGLPVAGLAGSPLLPPPSPHHSQPGPSAPPPNPLQTYCRRKCAAQPPPLSHHGQLGLSPNVLQTYCRRKCTKQSTPDRESFTESDYVPPNPGLPVVSSSSPESQLGLSSLPPSSLTDMSSQMAPLDISPPTLNSPGSSTGLDYVPPASPGLLVAGSPSPHSQTGPSSSPPSHMTDMLQVAHTDSPPLTSDYPQPFAGWDKVPPRPGSATGGVGPMSVDGLFSPPLSPSHGSQTVPATPPQGSESDMEEEIHYLLNPEPFPTEFWGKFLKG